MSLLQDPLSSRVRYQVRVILYLKLATGVVGDAVLSCLHYQLIVRLDQIGSLGVRYDLILDHGLLRH